MSDGGSTVRVLAPLQGWAGPLDEVPDPVFAERMLGDGLAIDPTGSTLHAPFDAVVISVHAARHAVALRADNGAEVLIHLGLETVALGGEGIVAHVAAGDRVTAGQTLLSFDLDGLARGARSLVTPVVLTNGDAFAITSRMAPGRVEVGAPLMELSALAGRGDVSPSHGEAASRTVRVPLAHGIHARPAAVIVARARDFAAEIEVLAGGRTANARSAVSLMALGVRCDDEIAITARGRDAREAVDALADLILADMPQAPDVAPAAAQPQPSPATAADSPGLIHGLRAAPGYAFGPAVQWRREQIAIAEAGRGADFETSALAHALAEARRELQAAASSGSQGGDILAAHLALLEDPEIGGAAALRIQAGASAGAAWRAALDEPRRAFAASGDRRIAERVSDLDDLERRVLRVLAGAPQTQAPTLPAGAILLADELAPSDLLSLSGQPLGGVCTVGGGPTCHMAIIAQAMGVPAMVAASARLLAVPEGEIVVLDADAGALRSGLDPVELAGLERQAARRQAALRTRREAAGADARLADGERIEVFANLGGVEDAHAAIANGAEGCGLLRTEFLFLSRQTAPDEAEQLAVYQAVADVLAGRPLVIRTLDIGADKPAPYLPMPPEANPALGLRGVRISLARPDLLRTQLRAILRVEPQGCCRIMVPMIAAAGEMAEVRAILDEERAALGAGAIELGAMIETPAAAICADLVAAQADFLSVGSNDLTQYAMAMDREHPSLAARQDGLDPAVLRLIAAAARGAAAKGRWLGVCGGLASDPGCALVLVGLGVSELSAAPTAVPEVKAALRTATLAQCRALADAALEQPTAAAVRRLIRERRAALAAAPVEGAAA